MNARARAKSASLATAKLTHRRSPCQGRARRGGSTSESNRMREGCRRETCSIRSGLRRGTRALKTVERIANPSGASSSNRHSAKTRAQLTMHPNRDAPTLAHAHVDAVSLIHADAFSRLS